MPDFRVGLTTRYARMFPPETCQHRNVVRMSSKGEIVHRDHVKKHESYGFYCWDCHSSLDRVSKPVERVAV